MVVYYSEYSLDWYVKVNGQVIARFSTQAAAWDYLRLIRRLG